MRILSQDEMIFVDDSDNAWHIDDFGKTVFLYLLQSSYIGYFTLGERE